MTRTLSILALCLGVLVVNASAQPILDVPTNLDLFGPKAETTPAQWQGNYELSWSYNSADAFMVNFNILIGPAPGVWSQSFDVAPMTTNFGGSWDIRLPLWVSLNSFYYVSPTITQIGDHSLTNNRTYSTNAAMLFLCTPALLPACWVSNGAAWVMGYGQSNMNYTLLAGGSNVFTVTGTNGPWFYMETVQPGARFFKTEVQP